MKTKGKGIIKDNKRDKGRIQKVKVRGSKTKSKGMYEKV